MSEYTYWGLFVKDRTIKYQVSKYNTNAICVLTTDLCMYMWPNFGGLFLLLGVWNWKKLLCSDYQRASRTSLPQPEGKFIQPVCQNKLWFFPFLSTKRGSTGTGSSRTQKNFFQKMFQLTPPRCVKKIGTFGAVDPKGMEGP